MKVDTTTTASQGLRRPQGLVLRVAGAGLLAATAAIHLDLYLTGYRTIPTIGWLFLLQVVAAFVLVVAVLVWGGRVVDAAGAGFAVATLGGYLLSVCVGLFGFTEFRTTAVITAGIIEIAAFATLATLALTPAAGGQPARSAGGGPVLACMRAGAMAGRRRVADRPSRTGCFAGSGRWPGTGGSGQPENRHHPRPDRTHQRKRLRPVLVALDTLTRSNCTGTCAAYWPPATGPRSPAQAYGNGLNLNDGLWHETTTSSRPAGQARQSAGLHAE